MKFIVERPEVHYSIMLVDADTPEEALKLVFNGDGEELRVEYSHTLEPEDNSWKAVDPISGVILAKMDESPDDEEFYVGSNRGEE